LVSPFKAGDPAVDVVEHAASAKANMGKANIKKNLLGVFFIPLLQENSGKFLYHTHILIVNLMKFADEITGA